VKFTRLKLRNWRNFEHLDVGIGDRLFVVGPNAAGKSNFLDVFRFLRDIARPGGGLAAAVDSRRGLNTIRSLFARRDPDVSVEVELADGDERWTYRLSLKHERAGRHRALVKEEVVTRGGKTLLSRPDEHDVEDQELLTQTHLEQITANREFRPLADLFNRTKYLHLVPQIIRDPRRGAEYKDDPFGGDFIARMNAEKGQTRKAWLKRLNAGLQAAVPQFESLEIDVDASGTPHLVAGYKNWRAHPTHQRETEFSDGTLRLIGLLWSLVSLPKSGGTLLLEEPELSLSSDVISKLPAVFQQAQQQREAQVLLTSHASELLDADGLDPSEILLLRVTNNGTVGHLLSDDSDLVEDIKDGVPPSEAFGHLLRPEGIDGLYDLSFA
jgi:predicted ATPase